MFIEFVVALFLSSTVYAEEKKWVWEDDSRKGKIIQERYEVIEDDNHHRPGHRPTNLIHDPHYQSEPYPNQQLFSPAHERPGGVYGNGISPTGNYGQGGPAVLTGPVPSWVKEYPIKDFDKCKCTEKFNCPSPGISYGHCDVGKQYCCYVTNPHKVIGHPIPGRPVYSADNGVLSGPGGPVDYPRPVYTPRPPLHNTQYGVDGNGVLSGPGGGGVYGRPYRPQYGRPGYGNGVYGGGYERPYGSQGQSGGGGYSVYERQHRSRND